MSLRPHQVEPANRLTAILANHNAVDLSDCGTGKTYVAAAVASRLKLPTLCVVPKISVSAWHRAAAAFDDKLSVIGYEKLRAGNTPYGAWHGGSGAEEDIFACQSCGCRFRAKDPAFPCPAHSKGVHCLTMKKAKRKMGQWRFHSGVRFIITDETHKCSGLKSQNAEMLVAARRQNLRVLSLSATMASSPLQLRALGYVMGLHCDKRANGEPDFYQWAARYKCRPCPIFRGLVWNAFSAEEQKRIMAEIHSRLIPSHGVRVRVDEIPDFPKTILETGYYDIPNPEELDQEHAHLVEALNVLKTRSAGDVAPDSPLTRSLRARQRIELLKLPVLIELIQDELDKNFSVAVFVNFRQTIDELAKYYQTDCIIDGSEIGQRLRGQSIENFQANRSRLVLVNSAAGGVAVSLHDTDGNFPRVGLVFPGQSATLFRQLLGRLPREGGKSIARYKIVCAANTVEEKHFRKLNIRLDNLDALNDSDLICR